MEQRVDVLRQTIIALVRREGPDLTARQLGVFLTAIWMRKLRRFAGWQPSSMYPNLPLLAPWIVSLSSIWCVERPTPWIGAAFWRSARRRAWRSSAT